MTQPKVKKNTKTYDLTFKVNCEMHDNTITKNEITVRVYSQHLGDAINRAKNHVRSKLINFHSFA